MARPEQCSDCTKKTTIHFTQIINNKVYKLDMCEDCPLKKEVIDPGNFSLTEIFNPASKTVAQGDFACESCGMTQVEFEKRGRFGCPDCYTHFAPAVSSMVKDMHYGTDHRGKKPRLALERIDLSQKVQHLRQALSHAVKQEDFEQAAVIRDQILAIESQLAVLSHE
jgi:protein arginine kinase activator